MKLSVVITVADAPPSAFAVFRGIEESIARAAALGYEGVELALGSPEDINPARLSQWLDRCNMEVSAISTGLVYAGRGIGLVETPEKAQKVFRALIDFAAEYGKKINIGRSRGFKRGYSFDEAAEIMKKTLEPLCDYAGRKEVSFLIEPVNRYEIDWINRIDEGAALIDRLGFANVSLMPDVFHMNIEDTGIAAKLREFGNYIGYIHLADSNRRSPGKGHIDFPAVFGALKAAGYDGWAGVEILPMPDSDVAAKEAVEYLKPLVDSYNGK
jgi:sugar phosphate isomerase/epimerase